ncbi:hypothetical protein B9Q13_04135 [Candidatus Marsarchaeota G2 archaeon ECH_B_SAG-G16]|uniref:Uncharacterized protein n=1 Tax=Candidatus Marsarchaeota G2 archaeon ECH_B_SAG-G16 TaxID=1978167 RepID=A0A2R6C174_9ARCH|nr:MAG: hypothetical protein B9Q13_04135 [Candidatus Marsarchaeota G2 archaeon ECH_B_SAG-G16]
MVAVDIATFLEEEGFREVECNEEEYYDEFGRFHELPRYKSAVCYQKEYEWGTATISKLGEYLDDITVYLNVNLPTAVMRIIDGSTDYQELDDAYAELVDASFKQGFSLSSGTTPDDYNVELDCKRDEFESYIKNLTQYVKDYVEYLRRVAEELLGKHKPDELEDVACEKCGATLKRYEHGYHLEEHEVEEAEEELAAVEKAIEEFKLPERSRYPLAYKHFEVTIKETIRAKILPLYKHLGGEVNRKIGEERGVKGEYTLNLKQFLYYFSDTVELIAANVPRELRRDFVEKYTDIRGVLSQSAYEKLLNLLAEESTEKIEEAQGGAQLQRGGEEEEG